MYRGSELPLWSYQGRPGRDLAFSNSFIRAMIALNYRRSGPTGNTGVPRRGNPLETVGEDERQTPGALGQIQTTPPRHLPGQKTGNVGNVGFREGYIEYQ